MYHTFSKQKTMERVIVPPVVKLRHAKVVVSRQQYLRKKPMSGMHSSRTASYIRVWCYFSREGFLEKYTRGGVFYGCCGP